MTADTAPWEQIVKRKRQLREDAIQSFLNSHSQAESDKSTSLDSIKEIQQAILSRAVTASDLCLAYISRLTEILFNDAIEQARELDEFFQKNGRLRGPLHGVPMTVKDQFDIKGYDSTLGYVGRAGKPAKRDAVVVKMLKQMGAVILAKSNLPQSIMWCETDNPLWGLTVHPANPAFTPGGSTGGEGTLLSLRGTVVGWGTDLGGSVRIPSHMNGVYGLKPSTTRLPYQDVSVSTEGQEHVPSVIGPLARNISSLIDVTKAVIDASPWDQDPKCSPMPWRSSAFEDVQSRPLVIAVMRDDGVVRPHPPVSRVLEDVVAKLEKAGHEIVEWTPGTLHQECIDIMDQYYTADGVEDIKRDVQAAGEPYIPHVQALINRGKAISVYEYWQLNKQKFAAQKRFLDTWNAIGNGKQLDILLAPVMPHAAVPHRQCRWVGYTKVFNFVDYPAVVIPAGHVSRDLDGEVDMASYTPRNELDAWNWGLYDVDAMHGLPIGVQIVARRLQEEKVLGAAQVIDDLLRGVENGA